MKKLYATEMREFYESDLFKALEYLVKSMAFYLAYGDIDSVRRCDERWKAYKEALKYITGKSYELRKDKDCCGIYESANYDTFLIKISLEECLRREPSNIA